MTQALTSEYLGWTLGLAWALQEYDTFIFRYFLTFSHHIAEKGTGSFSQQDVGATTPSVTKNMGLH